MARDFRIFPDEWRGARDDRSPLVIDTREWAASKNMDARFGWSAAGATLLETLTDPASLVIGTYYYFDTAGVLRRVVMLEDGRIFEEGTVIAGQTLGVGATLFQDAFTRADGSPGSNWTLSGVWLITDNQLTYEPTQGNGMAYLAGGAFTSRRDMAVEAKIHRAPDSGGTQPYFGVAARLQDTGNYYRAGYRQYAGVTDTGGIVILEKVVAGVVSQVGSVFIMPAGAFVLRLEAQASALRVFANGVLKLEAVDTSLSGTGTAGVYSGTGTNGTLVTIDDFQVESFDLQPTIPDAEGGIGSLVIARGVDQPMLWKNPGTGLWEALLAATGVTQRPRTLTIDSAGPRLFVAPDSNGPDSWSWSAAGDFTKWATADGGGSEPVGEDREPIVAARAGLGNDAAIFKQNHIYAREGSDPQSWVLHRISSDVGLTAMRSVVRVGKGMFFIHESGAYFLNAVGSVTFPPLSQRIQTTWDAMVEAYGAYLKYAHASYSPRENTIYAWVPNQASRVMNRLLKIYVPTGAITVHDDKPAGHSAFRTSGVGRIVYGGESGQTFTVEGPTDNGVDITSEFTTGIFSGTPPTPDREKRWGFRGALWVFLEATAEITVTITPTIYQNPDASDPDDDGVRVGTPQTVSILPGRVRKALIKFPDNMGWGFSMNCVVTQGVGQWRLVGYSGTYDEITDA